MNWPTHEVKTKHNAKWLEIRAWLETNNIGLWSRDLTKPEIVFRDGHPFIDDLIIKFSKEQDAILFKLRWG